MKIKKKKKPSCSRDQISCCHGALLPNMACAGLSLQGGIGVSLPEPSRCRVTPCLLHTHTRKAGATLQLPISRLASLQSDCGYRLKHHLGEEADCQALWAEAADRPQEGRAPDPLVSATPSEAASTMFQCHDQEPSVAGNCASLLPWGAGRRHKVEAVVV